MLRRGVLRIILPALALALLLLPSACREKTPQGHAPSQAATPGAAPDFALQDLSGRTVRLSDLRGKVVFLEFWATWCPPCKETVPELIALANHYSGKDFAVVSIAMDEGATAAERLRTFSSEHKINYPVLLGNEDVAREYNVRGIPAGFLIDKNGRIIDSYVGYVSDLQALVASKSEGLL